MRTRSSLHPENGPTPSVSMITHRPPKCKRGGVKAEKRRDFIVPIILTRFCPLPAAHAGARREKCKSYFNKIVSYSKIITQNFHLLPKKFSIVLVLSLILCYTGLTQLLEKGGNAHMKKLLATLLALMLVLTASFACAEGLTIGTAPRPSPTTPSSSACTTPSRQPSRPTAIPSSASSPRARPPWPPRSARSKT